MANAIVRGDTETTPENAKWTGETVQWGNVQRKVFVERVARMEHEEVTDPATGGPMYRRGPGGVTTNRIVTRGRLKGYDERRFILHDLGNGQTTKIYEPDYLPDPREAERKAREERRARMLDELFDASEKLGGIDAVVQSIKAAAAEAESAEYPKATGNGWWLLSNGMKVRGDEAVALAREAALHTDGEAA